MYFEIINLKVVCRLTHNTFTADGMEKTSSNLNKRCQEIIISLDGDWSDYHLTFTAPKRNAQNNSCGENNFLYQIPSCFCIDREASLNI
jgi:hypothetical protein